MINRKAFFEIFFYNRENPSREMMETAENVWRAYMQKYGLGLAAGNDGQPTYEEVREITYLANAAVEMMAAREAAASAPPPAPVYEPEEVEEEAPQEEEIPEPVTEETPAQSEEEPVEPVMEEAKEEPAAPAAEEAEEPQQIMEEEPAEKILPQIRPQQIVQEKVLPPVKPVCTPAVSCDIDIWVEQLIHWCEGKGFRCIKTVDEGDCYLHVYLPHKKEVLPVGKWCLKADTNVADLAAEISKLYAYCNGFADCFERLIK